MKTRGDPLILILCLLLLQLIPYLTSQMPALLEKVFVLVLTFSLIFVGLFFVFYWEKLDQEIELKKLSEA